MPQNINKIKKRRPGKGIRIFHSLRKIFSLNIGTILFGSLFIYMLISIFLYLTSSHITSYQVISGPLSRNQTYRALALRSEELVDSSTNGYVTYFTRENTKVKKNGAVIAVGSSPGKITTKNVKLTESQLSDIRKSMARFAKGFNPNHFYDTYSFKYEMEGALITSLSEKKDSSSTSQTLGDATINLAPDAGLVQFSKDGYENVTEDKLKREHFNQMSYKKTNLQGDQISAGSPAYKLITSEVWSLYIPLTDEQVVALSGRDKMRVKFLKDSVTMTGKFTLLSRDDGYYARITFSNGLLRYAADRFLDIELVTNTQVGLKIPISAKVKKRFYLVPKDYATKGGNADAVGFMLVGKNGKSKRITAPIYGVKKNYYLVDQKAFSKGDVLAKENSQEKFTIRDTASLEGVYCINKGYAVFRRINVIDQNKEYCIVSSGTDFGLALYDNIVYDGTAVKEDEILY